MLQLEKEIKTSKIENVFQQALINIVFTYHWSSQQIKEYLIPFNITQQQYNVLCILKAQYPNPATINLIRSKTLDKASDTSRIVDRLIQKQIVEKSANAQDKRAVDIMITDRGLCLLKKLEKNIDLSKLITPNITVAEAEQLNVLLDKIRG